MPKGNDKQRNRGGGGRENWKQQYAQMNPMLPIAQPQPPGGGSGGGSGGHEQPGMGPNNRQRYQAQQRYQGYGTPGQAPAGQVDPTYGAGQYNPQAGGYGGGYGGQEHPGFGKNNMQRMQRQGLTRGYQGYSAQPSVGIGTPGKRKQGLYY